DDPSAIRDFAQAAESLGYSHILIYDHVLGATHDREPRLTGPYTENTPFHEIFVLLGFLAACTERIGLATGVVILPQRQTALVAKQAAEVDVLSGGRLRLGIGTGWNYVEYDALNEDFHNRGARQSEQVELMRKLWTEPVVTFEGKWHKIDRAGILPRPARSIPVWFGGLNESALKRAARIGDGIMPLLGPDENGRAVLDRVRGYVKEYGRDPSSFGIEGFTNIGAPEESWRSRLDAWREAGATHVSVRTMNANLDSPQAHIDALRRYREVAVG
ncbi:MAG: LLM class F420-dependent oxidoreductase, partial [Dehalococcoidia bacterium]